MPVPTQMRNEKGEIENYLNATEASAFLGISFPTFKENYEKLLQAYQSPRRKNVRLFRVEDLEKLNVVKPIKEDENK